MTIMITLNEFNIFLFTTIFINIDINIFKDLKHFLIPQTNIYLIVIYGDMDVYIYTVYIEYTCTSIYIMMIYN